MSKQITHEAYAACVIMMRGMKIVLHTSDDVCAKRSLKSKIHSTTDKASCIPKTLSTPSLTVDQPHQQEYWLTHMTYCVLVKPEDLNEDLVKLVVVGLYHE